MRFPSFNSLAVAAAALCAASAASAQVVPVNGSVVPSGVVANLVNVNVAGIQSFFELGEPGNTVLNLNVGANNEVIGIGWDVTVSAFAPSYLSELGVAFGNSSQTAGVNLLVGFGDDNPGLNTAYSSGGVIALTPLGFNFNVGADGVLRLEFYEDFGDGVNPDGLWNSGALTIQLANAVPEPGTYGLMALGLLGVAAAARRKRAA